MMPTLPLRSLWPLPAIFLSMAALIYAQAPPSWVLAAAGFAAGAGSMWCIARAIFGRRMGELEATKQMLEKDVAEIRRLEQERKELYAQLLHSQKLEALGTLAGGVAHDLNNVLVPVTSLPKLILEKLTPGSREYASVELILAAGRRARDLARQVLAFSRNQVSDRKPLLLDDVVGGVLRKMRPSLPEGIVVDQQLAPVPAVDADQAQLEQVLSVLLSNATQAITGGVGTVTVEVAGDGGRLAALRASSAIVPGVRLTVRDTGCGMDAVTRRRIFEPFFTTKEVGRGTGLGLSIVHGIVAGHGGEISVESEPGSGTRFDIFLPCIAAGAGTASLSAVAA